MNGKVLYLIGRERSLLTACANKLEWAASTLGDRDTAPLPVVCSCTLTKVIPCHKSLSIFCRSFSTVYRPRTFLVFYAFSFHFLETDVSVFLEILLSASLCTWPNHHCSLILSNITSRVSKPVLHLIFWCRILSFQVISNIRRCIYDVQLPSNRFMLATVMLRVSTSLS